ncbi:MAG: hypothetical protein ACT4NY_09575 [Pseudonocardiales bacterium]
MATERAPGVRRHMGGEGGNSALRMLLSEAEMSNTGLARAVVLAGGREGLYLGTSTTSVKRWLDGAQPHWPVPRLVAVMLAQRLRREVTITECGFLDRTPAEEDRFDGLSSAGTLDGTVCPVVELSGQDMRRRRFLLGSAFSAGAFAEPALYALTVPPAQSTTRAGSGPRIGMTDVEVLTAQVTYLRQLDCHYGAGRVRLQMVQLLHHDANELAARHLLGEDRESHAERCCAGHPGNRVYGGGRRPPFPGAALLHPGDRSRHASGQSPPCGRGAQRDEPHDASARPERAYRALCTARWPTHSSRSSTPRCYGTSSPAVARLGTGSPLSAKPLDTSPTASPG